MKLNGHDYPNYPEDTNSYEMGRTDYERGIVEASGWRTGYTHAYQTYEASLRR